MAQMKIKGKGPIAIAVLLETEDNKLVLQLRDDKKEIHYPGHWSIFTGGLEESDWKGDLYSSLEYGVRRELSEELGILTDEGEIPFNPKEIKFISEGAYPDKSENYFDYQYTFYVKLDVPFDRLRLKEGQKLGLFSEREVMDLKIANSYRRIILKHFREKEKNKGIFVKFLPKISLIIPTYNVEKYIFETLQSVKNQTADPNLFEVIIVDDCSTDNTPFIIEKEIKDMTNVIYKRKEVNEGTSVARNEAIELSNGEYIALLDSDDLLEPIAIESTLKLIKNHPDAAYFYSKYKRIDAKGNSLPDKPGYPFSKKNLYHFNLVSPFTCFSREIHNKIGGFEKGNEAEDWDHALKASEVLREDQVIYNPEFLYLYRIHDESKSFAQVDQVRKSAVKMLINALNRINLKVKDISFRRTEEGHSYYDWERK